LLLLYARKTIESHIIPFPQNIMLLCERELILDQYNRVLSQQFKSFKRNKIIILPKVRV
jgi:hypothetical protein